MATATQATGEGGGGVEMERNLLPVCVSVQRPENGGHGGGHLWV